MMKISRRVLEIWVCVGLVVIAASLLSYQITRPLTDYDEAIYANRIVSTLRSGDILTPSLNGYPEYDKPPLYYWMTMPFVEIFGPQEWTFRLPGIMAAILCYVLVFLIVQYLTDSIVAASGSFLLLLFAPWFYFLSIEARLDSGVIASILAALFFLIRGWRNPKYLLLFFPTLAIGFLIKSIIVLLIVPVAIIYCSLYKEWQWIKSRYLWVGLVMGLGIFLPWHIYETLRFGSTFWQIYIFAQLSRTTATITGTYGLGDYVIPVVTFMPLWFWSCVALLMLFVVCLLRYGQAAHVRRLAAPLISSLLIFLFFSAAKTHLGSYVLPAYPFLAIFVGQFLHTSVALGKRLNGTVIVLTTVLIMSGAYYCFSIPWADFQDQGKFVQDEKNIGDLYRNHAKPTEPLYSLMWDGLDTINFYSGTSTRFVNWSGKPVTNMKAPFFLVMTGEVAQFFNENLPSVFKNFKIMYVGKYLMLFYSVEDMSVGG